MLSRKKICAVLFCFILLSMITVRGQFVEGKVIQSGNENQSVSLNEQEIAEEVNKQMLSAFLENKGQVGNEEVIFYGSLPNGKIAFSESKVMLRMEGVDSIVTLNFVGARKVSPIGLDELIRKSNYFLGGRGTFKNVRSFGAIIYYDLWNGIDLYYQATPKGAKYEFRVAAGANPEDININCEGQDQLFIEKDSLLILMRNGQFVDAGLKVLQDGIEIDAKFVLKRDNTFGFQISNYNQFKPLIIDPLIYSTLIGGDVDDSGKSITLDSNGCVYVTGYTESSDFPTTANAFNNTYSGGGGSIYYGDCFVFKLSANGSILLFSTFVGGNESDHGNSIALDNDGNVHVTGETRSSNFPTTTIAYNKTHGGNADCFVFKLAANGSSLLYSTFVGRKNWDYGYSIALDSAGIAYVAGRTTSSNFPTTEGAYNRTHSGHTDCFVFKLAANGSSLHYSTFVGGPGNEYVSSFTIDNEGNAYVTGMTYSDDFPTTNGAFDETANGGIEDCFVFKLSADGSSLLYSTFIGGSSNDYGKSIAVDSMGNACVTGRTSSSNFPTTEGVYNRTKGGGSDCFVIKLSADGSSLLYSTFVGGSDTDSGSSITLDNEGVAYVTGYSYSTNFPTTKGAYNRTINGVNDCFVFKLSTDGSNLLYSTLIGGSSNEFESFIVIDDEGNTYVTGGTTSSNFPTTENAYNRIPGGEYDCFVFILLTEAVIPSTLIPTNEGAFDLWFNFSVVFILMITLVVYRKKKVS